MKYQAGKEKKDITKAVVVGMDAKGNSLIKDYVTDKNFIVEGALLHEKITYQHNNSKRRQRRKKVRLHSIVHSPWEKIKPFCPHFKLCGGCSLQELMYKDQLQIKQEHVHSLFAPLLSSLEYDVSVLPIVACDNYMYYRNKVDYTFGDRRWLEHSDSYKDIDTNNLKGAGFHVKGFYDKVVHINECFLHKSNGIRNVTHQWAIENDIEYFNSRYNKGFLRMMTVRTAKNTNAELEYMLIISFAFSDDAKIKQLCDILTKKFINIVSIYVVINDGTNDVVQNLEHIHMYGKKYIQEHCNRIKDNTNITYNIYPKVFYQTNSEQAQKLYARIFEFAQVTLEDEILDLYCGIGSIGLYFAPYVKKVIGVDSVLESIKAAEENANINNISNAHFFAMTSENAVQAGLEVNEELSKMIKNVSVVIVDPPRAGLHKKVKQYLCEQKPPVIVYVSCNPKTLVEDISDISEFYKIVKFQAVDMFPHTFHIETVVRLELK